MPARSKIRAATGTIKGDSSCFDDAWWAMTLSEPTTDPERRFRWILLIIGSVIVIFGIAVCATFASVTQYVVDFRFKSPTPDIQITGTVNEIAGMPIPPDGVLTNQTLKHVGGTFDYETTLRPRQIYNFYFVVLTRRGIWQASSNPQIDDQTANFEFYPGTVPRLTIIDVNCTSQVCKVHVDY